IESRCGRGFGRERPGPPNCGRFRGRTRIVEPAMGIVARVISLSIGCALLLGACRTEHEAEWLALHAVDPSLLELGGTLRVTGSGFPAGSACDVRFEGRTL